jgi:predicted transcriptional regulator
MSRGPWEALVRRARFATLDDAFDRLFVLHKIERGLKEARQGQTMPQQEVEAYFRQRRASQTP